MKSILVIRLSSLGDVVLTTPIVRMVKRAYPEVIIDVAVDDRYSEVWNDNPYIRNVLSVSKGNEQAFALHPYDVIIDLQRNNRSARIIRLLRSIGSPKIERYRKHRLEKLALVYCKRKPKRVTHIVERYLEPLRRLGVPLDRDGLELWTPGPRAETNHGLSVDLGHRLRIGVAPGAQHATKRYPADQMAQVVHSLVVGHNAEVVLLGGSADTAICDALAQACKVPVSRVDGATSIAQTVGILDTLNAVISCDSAVVHLASARGIPVAVVYGSTTPELGFTPYNVEHVIIEAADIPCRPCTHIGRSDCPKGHFHCMTTISPLQVANATVAIATRRTSS